MAERAGLIAPGRVAVVTGAASGIGLALSERFAARGMSVVMADVEKPALSRARDRLAAQGSAVLAVVTDVSQPSQVDRLRDRTLEELGAVHVLCNNAGVGSPAGPLWDISPHEWEWVLGVNLLGVVNGIRSFMPALLEQPAAHVVNTASMAGLTVGVLGPYSVSKHAVVALSEALYFQLQQVNGRVGVSVLCPGWVRTRIADFERNRPPAAGPARSPDALERAIGNADVQMIENGMDPAEVAGIVCDAIDAGRFYILTDPAMNPAIERRTQEILRGGPPTASFG